MAARTDIDTSFNQFALDATCWIGCCRANPHRDAGKGWDGLVFITLSVVSEHSTGDVKLPGDDIEVPAGSLFVIDPRVKHWLYKTHTANDIDRSPWVGLQWEVPRKKAAQVAREIVASTGGTWLATTDRRYSGWAPVAG